jgi:O-methyltransferase involved in polyketide biosynthesis
MQKQENLEIHETAFVTSTFRSMNENLSQDFFSKLWKNEKTEIWIKDYLKEVSSEETCTHCLRNRYFLDKIKEVIKNNNIEVLLNFGCGLSMYPFLLNEKIINIEIDKPEIIEYKKSKIDIWQTAGVLPKRNIHFIAVDFSKDYKQKLLAKIDSIKNNKSCFILIEGVLFFLNKEETNKLFDFFNLIQNQGDFIGSASFQESLKETLAFKKLLIFFNVNVSKTSGSDYQTIQDEYYRKRKEYQLIDHQDYFSLSKKYEHKIELEKDLILNENFYLLEKSSKM